MGTGRLARSVCYSLAVECAVPVEVLVLGRTADNAAAVCFVASTRAAASGRPVRFEPRTGDLDALLAEPDLDGVLVCASSQSPWERRTRPSAWTELLARAGFGLTLPFQAAPALRAGRALAARTPRPWLLNACFPDAVNPLLAALGVPVLAGIGNVGLLAASAQAALGLPDQSRLRMLAHHVHLHTPAPGVAEALAWCDDTPVADPGALLAAQRATDRAELNHVTGHTAALLITALLADTPLDTHLPGPNGLPGGYPVRLHGTELTLRLPAALDEPAAVAFNQLAAAADGVVVDAGRVTFAPDAAGELDQLVPDLATGFPVADLDSATAELGALRDRLRAEPAGRPQGVPG
ncbi:hypothetical protein [Actinophytocola gossypii]|uniref:Potassium transporter TrkA n=1 Tax=Actinophytocola gossypii TaxID=2812003 RepID=A0ABT2J358_9PSEU|nr:hypothetical protein [Actinophytocola gossypii]MCT2581935.1 hypothetical protein [Actinophytocola gossypii]